MPMLLKAITQDFTFIVYKLYPILPEFHSIFKQYLVLTFGFLHFDF